MSALRVVQWTTGKVATQSIKAILDRPELELVGLYAFSKEKVGQDVGDLIQLGRKLGVKATNDIDALLALKPDCIVYMPLHPDVPELARLLRAGVNVVTTASFITGRGYGEPARKELEEAARAGGVSLFGSGINPGWVDALVANASSLCRDVNLVKVTESFNIGLWAADANQDVIGWGRPANDPEHPKAIEKATLPFGDAVEAIAKMFKFALDDVRCEVSFAHATEDLDVPGRIVKKGTVAGVIAKWLGIAQGHPVIELNAQWVVSDDVEPAWEIAMAYLIEVQGTPQLKLRAEVLPTDMNLPMEELIATGSIITASPVVNAIASVVAARPGIVTYADLPPVTSVLRPKAQAPAPVPLRAVEEAAAPKSAPTSVEGQWKVTIKGPTGPKHTVLALELANGVWTGSQSGDGNTSPISEAKVDGAQIYWVNHTPKPMKLKCEFKGVIDGAQMTGKMKAGFMGSYNFTAVKV
ncbi:MAG: dihydrodipicolinate reductase [Polyangiales bacterium]